jgi:hypothetical protein
MVWGNFRSTRWLLFTHIGLALGSVLFLGIDFWRRYRTAPAISIARLEWNGYLGALLFLVIFPAGITSCRHYFPSRWDRIRNPITAPASMFEEGDGAQSLFFPSSASTTTGKTIPPPSS